jgi:hypothetical protein
MGGPKLMNPDITADDLRKPVRGEYRRARRDKRMAGETYLREQKRIAKARDGGKCRWPGCDCGKNGRKPLLESAHLIDKSRGGSDDASNLISLCDERHRGTPSLHSKDLHIEPLTPHGANGVCAFYARHPETGKVEHVATERIIGLSAPRGA